MRWLSSRGYTLVEVLVAMMVLLVLIFAVGDAIAHAVRMESVDAGRAAGVRSFSELTARLSEEARSSTAVFLPSVDVLGGSNDAESGGAHEIDFYRRLSAGGDAYVAYCFDSHAGTVTRYEYSRAAGVPAIVHADVVASGIAALAAQRTTTSGLADVVGGGSVSRVSVMYGAQDVIGGNDIVSVSLRSQAIGGAPGRSITLHLAPRIAPTSLAVLVPAQPLPPPPVGVRTIPFVINIIHGSLIHPPHGPWHFADPGVQLPDGGASTIHFGSVAGVAQWIGPGEELDWLALASDFATLSSGTYTYANGSGGQVTVAISCGQTECPRFVPLPVSGSSPPPLGSIAFDDAP
ncbi:MAG TPA: prepilin-type N-terminal cleavage/methylation domain-containing protein [Candidatus Tumulicola sp.]|nr:prepilin-type N-terminal cleavage/methylation domain-containing protein [Candidatus Tumulicola sp.]